jgi:hypothetical protein
MNIRWTTWLAVSLWTLSVVLICCALVLLSANSTDQNWFAGVAVYVAAMFSLATIGALLAVHLPGNPIAWIFLIGALSLETLAIADEYARYITYTNPNGAPELNALFWIAAWVWIPAVFLPASFGILLFPTGSLPSKRWRPLAWLVATMLLVLIIAEMFTPGPLMDPADDYPQLTNPVAIDSLAGQLGFIVTIAEVLLIAILVGPAMSIFVRLRAANTVQRQQIKWFAYAAIIPLIAMGAYMTLLFMPSQSEETANLVGLVIILIGLTLLPVTIGIAILRHDLYDIDRLINRTLVYGSLTVGLVATYFAMVLSLGTLLRTVTSESSSVVVAASTLAAAAMFRPMRARIQSAVDQRFYRHKYDAARTLEGFNERLRDEIELDTLSTELQGIIQETMQPAYLSIWLRQASRQGDRP